jgi:uncharacterized protein (DUF302 family)
MRTQVPEQSTLVECRSSASFELTVQQLVAAIETAGMTVFARFDHAAAAAQAGLQMPPTTVLVYGNPKAGTPLMLKAPQFALDLPLKVLVREDAGVTWVAYHPVLTQAALAGLTEQDIAPLQKAQTLIETTVRTLT